MMKAAFLPAFAALALAGCVSGQAEFAPMQGASRAGNLEQAKAQCRMRLRDTSMAGMGNVRERELFDDAADCFAAQGWHLEGYRHDDGTLTKYPYKGSQPAGWQCRDRSGLTC